MVHISGHIHRKTSVLCLEAILLVAGRRGLEGRRPAAPDGIPQLNLQRRSLGNGERGDREQRPLPAHLDLRLPLGPRFEEEKLYAVGREFLVLVAQILARLRLPAG